MIPQGRKLHRSGAFTLLELLVVMVVVAVLAAAAMTAAGRVRGMASDRVDMARYRKLAQAMVGWAGEHNGRLPRSSHSAFPNSELGWRREILPQLGHPDTQTETFDRVAKSDFGIISGTTAPRGPALNVYFELDPASDDYDGSPATWRNLATIPNLASTVLLTAAPGHPDAPMADHVMAHYLAGTATQYPATADGRHEGVVAWGDGHVTMEKPAALFDQSAGIDRFHPQKSTGEN